MIVAASLDKENGRPREGSARFDGLADDRQNYFLDSVGCLACIQPEMPAERCFTLV